MEWLIVGDLHAKKNNIEESEAIIDWAIKEAQSRNAGIILLGDTLNDFGVLRVELLLFFDKIFNKLAQSGVAVVILKGNHDENSQGTMTYLKLWQNRVPDVNIVLDPYQLGNILFVPFIRDNNLFKSTLEAYPTATVVVCHQEFDGCMYENGFYSPHGFKVENLPNHVKIVVSGHIHKTQTLGSSECPITYIGIPRHLTKSDLSHIPVVASTFDFKNIEFIEVPESIAVRFKNLIITDTYTKSEFKELMKVTDRSRFYIEIHGTKVFIKKTLKDYDWNGFKVKTVPNDDKQHSVNIKESEGIRTSFGKYLFSYADKNGLGQTETRAIVEQLKELIPEMV